MNYLRFVMGLLLVGTLRATPVSEHGALAVRGAAVVDQAGHPVALSGVSLFWSQWQSAFWNAGCVDWLAHDWRAEIVRAPVGIGKDGYLEHPDVERARVETVVDAAIAAGVYVIIDWHDHRAPEHVAAAEAFFRAMAKKYRGNPAVLYEIFNEPEKVSWSQVVKPYAERVIGAIRAIEPNALIIVGTPQWCQRVDEAAANPIAGKNIVYALHFYAGTHKAWLREYADAAMARGLPLFVSEWGGCNADGDGPLDHESIAQWLGWMREHHLSNCCWAMSNKTETSSLVVPSASPTGHWKEHDLTPWGKFVRGMLRKSKD
jgi:endoglucanase